MKWEHSVNRLKLERFVLGELPENEAFEINEKIRQDKKLEKEYNAILTSNQEILKKYPSEAMAISIENCFSEQHKNDNKELSFSNIVKKTIPYFSGLAIAALALFVVGPVFFTQSYNQEASEEIVYAKGLDSRIILYLKEGSDSRILKEGDLLKEGDELRIAYFSGNAPYGVILSIDGRNTITVHYPYGDGQNPLISTGKEVRLDFSYELDDAPKYEKFYFITSRNTFDTSLIIDKTKEMLKQNAKDLPNGIALGEQFAQFSILVQKEDSLSLTKVSWIRRFTAKTAK